MEIGVLGTMLVDKLPVIDFKLPSAAVAVELMLVTFKLFCTVLAWLCSWFNKLAADAVKFDMAMAEISAALGTAKLGTCNLLALGSLGLFIIDCNCAVILALLVVPATAVVTGFAFSAIFNTLNGFADAVPMTLVKLVGTSPFSVELLPVEIDPAMLGTEGLSLLKNVLASMLTGCVVKLVNEKLFSCAVNALVLGNEFKPGTPDPVIAVNKLFVDPELRKDELMPDTAEMPPMEFNVLSPELAAVVPNVIPALLGLVAYDAACTAFTP
jgi:hypothetical protein